MIIDRPLTEESRQLIDNALAAFAERAESHFREQAPFLIQRIQHLFGGSQKALDSDALQRSLDQTEDMFRSAWRR